MSGTPLRRLTLLDIGTERHFRWLAWIVGAVLVLNALDAAFTLLWVHAGLASEGSFAVFLIYYAVLLYHLGFVARLLQRW